MTEKAVQYFEIVGPHTVRGPDGPSPSQCACGKPAHDGSVWELSDVYQADRMSAHGRRERNL